MGPPVGPAGYQALRSGQGRMKERAYGRARTTAASTQVSTVIRAARSAVYQACIDPDKVAMWRVPDNMRAKVEIFDARQGGIYRMALTYRDRGDAASGKSSSDTDRFQGRFVELVPLDRIVEAVEFESPDPQFAGEMRITTTFADTERGTEVTILCQNLPPGIRLADNETGTIQALKKLTALLEREGV